ncbi:antitoxin [Lonepinella sp. BR2271]|uniref:antitoxin n=1 Tax=Lonepinella sp. BR2271 TaxID=3434550 RepID=UPI003F6E3EED
MQTAKLFMNGQSQAVRLPAQFRFPGVEVYIRKDEDSGDVILSKRPPSWDGFLQACAIANQANETLDLGDRSQIAERDPFDDWQE